jgi:hypothetical protein
VGPANQIASGGARGDGVEEDGSDGCADLLAGGDHRRTDQPGSEARAYVPFGSPTYISNKAA